MKVIKLEERENESLFWEIAVVAAFVMEVFLLLLIVYIAIFDALDSKTMGIAAGLNLTLLAVIFIGIKKGVLPQERIYVKI